MKQYKSVRTFFLALVLLGVSLTHRSGLKGEEMEITKAIIPAAGLGTRFLPYLAGRLLPVLVFEFLVHQTNRGHRRLLPKQTKR